MPTTKKKINLYESDEGVQIKIALSELALNKAYNTESSYSSNAVANPGHSISFVDKHMKYLNEHQNINPEHYLANLRLMTKLKKRIT